MKGCKPGSISRQSGYKKQAAGMDADTTTSTRRISPIPLPVPGISAGLQAARSPGACPLNSKVPKAPANREKCQPGTAVSLPEKAELALRDSQPWCLSCS
jgi:hypothetical protein